MITSIDYVSLQFFFFCFPWCGLSLLNRDLHDSIRAWEVSSENPVEVLAGRDFVLALADGA